ncbi:hypothetical protein GCM10023403_30480 [Pseudonocardia benzenivorans]
MDECVATRGQMMSGNGARSTAEVAADARAIVAREIAHRGGQSVEARDGRRWELRGTGPVGRFRVRVVSRRSGDWQSSIREGDGAGDPERHWVFVDLSGPPRFWILPEPEVVQGIRDRHREYLARNDGRRVQNDASLHCKITTIDVAHGAERWERLGLA